MIADTGFLIDLTRETAERRVGPARRWLMNHRHQTIWTTVISLGELAVGMQDNGVARTFLARYRVVNLQQGVAYTAASLDRELIRAGNRLGENDTWIAGYALYYRAPLLSNDRDFDRVPGLRRVQF
jgi:predicted nucleic acid-binding protein